MRSIEYLNQRNAAFRIISLNTEVHSAQDVASVCNCKLSEVLKALVLTDGDIKVLALLPGNLRVDKTKLAVLANAKKLKMATPDEVLALTGYEVGSVSPFGLNDSILRIMDSSVFDEEKALIGSGEKTKLLEFETDSLKNTWNGMIGDFSI